MPLAAGNSSRCLLDDTRPLGDQVGYPGSASCVIHAAFGAGSMLPVMAVCAQCHEIIWPPAGVFAERVMDMQHSNVGYAAFLTREDAEPSDRVRKPQQSVLFSRLQDAVKNGRAVPATEEPQPPVHAVSPQDGIAAHLAGRALDALPTAVDSVLGDRKGEALVASRADLDGGSAFIIARFTATDLSHPPASVMSFEQTSANLTSVHASPTRYNGRATICH